VGLFKADLGGSGSEAVVGKYALKSSLQTAGFFSTAKISVNLTNFENMLVDTLV
jgi:hypothetical protein